MFVARKWWWRTSVLSRAAFAAGALLALLATRQADSATAAPTFNCAGTGSPQGPYSFDTWEAGDYKTRYSDSMDLAGLNELYPDNSSFALPALETGDRNAGSGTTVPA